MKVFVAVLMYDGLPDKVCAFSTRDKANQFLFDALDGNEKGLYFNDLLEYDPAPQELVDSAYVGTGIHECEIDSEDPPRSDWSKAGIPEVTDYDD